jgi:hypothetical protein
MGRRHRAATVYIPLTIATQPSVTVKWGKTYNLLSAYEEEYNLLSCTAAYFVKVHRSFGETYRLHLQDRRVSQARNQQYEESWFLAWLTLSSTFKMEVTRCSEKSADLSEQRATLFTVTA